MERPHRRADGPGRPHGVRNGDVRQGPRGLRRQPGERGDGESMAARASARRRCSRRLVEAGVTFVLVSGAWVISTTTAMMFAGAASRRGSRRCYPCRPRGCTLINDLEARGLLDTTMVMMMGEFGRTPVINDKAGRGHWTNVMSMLTAGGGMQTGQVIGSTDRRGYDIASRPVRPGDLAATTFAHLGIDPPLPLDQPPRPPHANRHRRRRSDPGIDFEHAGNLSIDTADHAEVSVRCSIGKCSNSARSRSRAAIEISATMFR
ncbi:MAG: DUF1501 domain-containing protein [Pirellulales bacterium]